MRVLSLIILSHLLFCSLAYSRSPSLGGQLNKTNPLYGMLVGPDTVTMDKPILRPFSTDGCSMSPNSSVDPKRLLAESGLNVVQIVDCCVEHDVAYWLGGSLRDKNAADAKFKMCVAEKAGDFVADKYFRGVAFGGTANGFTTFRFGYGWDVRRIYRPISAQEMEQAERLYGKGLEQLHEMIRNKTYEVKLELVPLDMATFNQWHDDIIVYTLLQNTLKRQDIVNYGRKLYFENNTYYYAVGLKSCGESRVLIKLRRMLMIRDLPHLTKNIRTMTWDQLKMYVEKVEDPNNCLQ